MKDQFTEYDLVAAYYHTPTDQLISQLGIFKHHLQALEGIETEFKFPLELRIRVLSNLIAERG